MSIRKFFAATALTLSTLVATPALADDVPHHKSIGMAMDIGAPNGGSLGLVVSPWCDWLRLTAAGSYNGMAPGLWGGLTLDPINFSVAPTLTFESGHSFYGRLPGLNKMPELSTDYINLHAGLEFGKRNSWRFFFHAGPSWLWLHTKGFASVVDNHDPTISIGDPSASGVVFPSAKLGIVILF